MKRHPEQLRNAEKIKEIFKIVRRNLEKVSEDQAIQNNLR